MRRWIIAFVSLLVACTTQSPPTPESTPITQPINLTPADAQEFVSSDLELSWEYPALESDQRFVVRLWFGDEQPQEVWIQANNLNAQAMIDAYSRDVGNFAWQVAVVNTNDEGGFDSMASEWSTVQTLQRVHRLTLEPFPTDEQSPIAQYIASHEFETTTELVDFTREFIHNHTNITDPASYEPDYSDAMQMVLDHALEGTTPPDLYCDGMSTGMLTIFRELGIESRLIFLYGEVPGWISEHTFLEVFNPDTQRWEVTEPTFNLYFVDTETGERASVERLVFGSLDTIHACRDGECNSEWLNENREYLQAFRYGYTNEVFVNPDRFDISRRITAFDDANFPEFLGGDPRDWVFRFDSWQ